MQTITIIIGLPGSGKSTYIEQHSEEFKNAVVCDDYHKSSFNRSRLFGDSVYYKDLREALLSGKDAALADIAWCKTDRRETFLKDLHAMIQELQLPITTTCLFFENNPEACKINIKARNRTDRLERELEFVDEASTNYHIPEGSMVIPVITR